MSKKITALLAAAALFVGIGVGAATGSDPEPKVETIVKTKEVEVEADPIVKVETKTVTEKVVPKACTDALDVADNVILLAGDGFGYAGDALNAVNTFDVVAIEEANANMEEMQPDLTAALDNYATKSENCRSAS